jgi:hypothetical protein
VIPTLEKLFHGEFEHAGARVKAELVGEPVYETKSENLPAPDYLKGRQPPGQRTIHRIAVRFRAAFPDSGELPRAVIDALQQEIKSERGGHSVEALSGRGGAPHTVWFGFLDPSAALEFNRQITAVAEQAHTRQRRD